MVYKDNDGIYDILGMKSRDSSINREANAKAFLANICQNSSDEFDKLLNEKLGKDRKNNALKIIKKAEELYTQYTNSGVEKALPQIIYKAIEEGSWVKSYMLQDWWAGLISSACTREGADDSNLVFISLLSQTTRLQAKVLEYGCKASEKYILKGGGLAARTKTTETYILEDVTGVRDYHRLDRELDNMRYIGLISGGFDPGGNIADITPTQLGLHMYVRCQGFAVPPIEYFRGINRRNQNKKTLNI